MILNKSPDKVASVDGLRPISITSIMLKLWEFILLKQIVKQIAAPGQEGILTEQVQLYRNQLEFRSN